MTANNTFLIGFIFPTKREAKGLIDSLTHKTEQKIRGRQIIQGTLDQVPCAIVITGIGKVQASAATQLLIDHCNCSFIFHLGAAGAISKDLGIGDLVIGNEIISHDHYSSFGNTPNVPRVKPDPKFIEPFYNFSKELYIPIKMGSMLSGDEDIVTAKRRDELYEKYNALSVDWESFACAKVCQISEVQYLVIRTICDFAYENTATEFKLNFEKVTDKLCLHVINFIKKNYSSGFFIQPLR